MRKNRSLRKCPLATSSARLRFVAATIRLMRLPDLLDWENADDRVMKAEIARELGRFEDALSMLAEAFPEKMQTSVDINSALCQKKDVTVAEVPPSPL